ncbi:MAG TPA: VgrG-related protein, partial [Dehalococcoidia bacterium]|nr:VgrG-related protein [Dehalococcoidia bacterium]
SLGNEELKTEVFAGEITALELDVTMGGTVELLVRAFDRAHRLHRGRFSKVYRNMKDSDIAREIAAAVGLRADVKETREVHEYVFQDNETNWEFLQDRATRLGFELQVRDKTLVFKPPPSAPSKEVSLAWQGELLSFRARMVTGEQVNEVEVRGWDPVNKKPVSGIARQPKGTPEVGESRSGGQVAQSAFQKPAKCLVARQPIYSQAQADLLAQTVLNDLAGTFITAEGVALGDPELRLGSEVNLSKVGKQFTGKYVVTQIAHVYQPDSYTIEFEVTGRRSTDLVSLVSQHAAPEMHVLTGLVSNVKDDLDLGRVKVKLPTFGPDIESNWCRVAAPGAGPNRGMQYLPELNDEVLLVGSDINHLYVLGGLWSKSDPPPLKNSAAVDGKGQVTKRVIQSRTGHQILLDDSDSGGSITIVDSTGKNRLFINTATKDVEIEATGNIKLKAAKGIELEAGTDVKMKSGTQFEIEATTNLKVQSQMQATFSGRLGASLGSTTQLTIGAPSINLGPTA